MNYFEALEYFILLIKLAPTLLFNNLFDNSISITIIKEKKKKPLTSP